MTLHDRFLKLIDDLFNRADEKLQISDDGVVFQFRQRQYHVGLNVRRSEIVVSTQIYFSNENGIDVYPDIISEFNVYHLFAGGYRLNVDPRTHYLYVSQNKSLDKVEPQGLLSYLEDLTSRCVSCTRWYMAEVAKKPATEIELTDLDFSDIAWPAEAVLGREGSASSI